MADNNIDKRREEARRAMSSGRQVPLSNDSNKVVQMSGDNILESKDLATNIQPEEGLVEKLSEAEELEKKRLEAKKAMEGTDRRTRREEAERKKAEIELRQHQIDEVKKKRELIEKEQLINSEQQNLAKAEAEKIAADTYRENVETAKKKTSQIMYSLETIEPAHTLKTDFQHAATTDALSAAQTAIKERTEELRKETKQITNNRKSLALSATAWVVIIAIIVGGTFVVYWAAQKIKSEQIQIAEINIPKVVQTENIEEIKVDNLTPSEITTAIKNLIRPAATGETLQGIYFTKTNIDTEGKTSVNILTATDFLAITNIDLPEDFVYFLNDHFLISVYTKTNEPSSLAYIFKTRSFAHTFDSLLRNENAIITKLYYPYISTSAYDALSYRNFEDKIIENKDVRVLSAVTGEEIIFYTFLDQETLVITESRQALAKIAAAYNQARAAAK